METVELAINITEVARDEGLALVARITGEDFITIVSTKSGVTWGTMHTAVFEPDLWECYTEFPGEMMHLIGEAAPVFGSSEVEWSYNFNGRAYFEVDIGYKIIEEAVTLTNGERLKGWVVSPPEIKAKRGAEYDFLRQANAYDGTFYFWQPGKLAIRALEPKEVKKIEVINNDW